MGYLLLWAKVCIVRLRFKKGFKIQFEVAYLALSMDIQQTCMTNFKM